MRFDHLDRDEREEELAIGKLYIDLARRLGAGFVRVFGDVLPSEKEPAARHDVLRNIAGGPRRAGGDTPSCTAATSTC